MSLKNLEPEDVARWLSEKAIVLIDVREPAEYGAERIPGALLYPISTFDPAGLPTPGTRDIVFHCGSGVRSAQAVVLCEEAGLGCGGHMRGGLKAWKAAGLPTLKLDAASGQMTRLP